MREGAEKASQLLKGLGHPLRGPPDNLCLAQQHTINVLAMIAQLALLRHHTIDTPESRGGFGGLPHTSAVVREKGNGQKWVIDGWTHNNGEYPDIMKLEKWKTES